MFKVELGKENITHHCYKILFYFVCKSLLKIRRDNIKRLRDFVAIAPACAMFCICIRSFSFLPFLNLSFFVYY